MVEYGLTDQGFNIKSLAVIKDEIEKAIQAVLGSGMNISENSPLGQIIGIIAERESLLWELAQANYNSQYPDTAEGTSLDNANALTNISRLGALASTIVARCRGTATTIIPAGSIASVLGNSLARFVTDANGIIAAAVNAQQKITFSSVPDSGNWTITFDGQTTGSLAFNANAAAVETALELLSNITSVTVSGDYTNGFTIEFNGADAGTKKNAFTTSDTLLTGATPVELTVTVLDEGGAYIDIACTAENTGAIQAPAGSLTVIETAVSGWDSVDNLEDASLGRAVETDAAYRLRRTTSLQQAESGTVEAIKNKLIQDVSGVTKAIVIENDGVVPDGDGRPAKSFECIVQGGAEQAIAEAIFEVKAAGIQAYGSISKTVVDSEGNNHTIAFSRPSEIDIYIVLTVTKISGATMSETDVKNALLVYGNALDIGDDVITYPDLIASLEPLPITDVTLTVGTAPAPGSDANIVIAADEIADFDSSRIAVTIV